MNTTLILLENKQATSVSKLKITLITLLGFLVCGYLLIFKKIMEIRRMELEEIGFMAMETEQMLEDLHALDANLKAQIQQFNEFYINY